MPQKPHARLVSEAFRLNLLFAVLQSFFWGAHCVYFSFLVIYLNSKSYSHATIGLLMMLLSVLGIVVPTAAGYLADFFIPIKKIVTGCLLLSIPAAFLLPATVSFVPLAFVSVCCMGVLEKNLASVIDSWSMRIGQQKKQLNYGFTRGCASLSYAAAGLVFGNVFHKVGLDALFFVHAGFVAVALLAACLLDPIPVSTRKAASAGHEGAVRVSYARVLLGLLQGTRYRLLVISLVCYGVSTVAIHTFQPLLITEIGGTSADLGICLAVMAASEFPMMLLFQRISYKIRCDRLLAFAFFCTMLRVLAPAFVPSMGWLIAVQPIHAISFGLYLPCVLKYVSEITPSQVKATSITFAMACADGVAGVLGNFLGGLVSGRFGVRGAFLALAAITCVGFVVFCISFRTPLSAAVQGEADVQSYRKVL